MKYLPHPEFRCPEQKQRQCDSTCLQSQHSNRVVDSRDRSIPKGLLASSQSYTVENQETQLQTRGGGEQEPISKVVLKLLHVPRSKHVCTLTHDNIEITYTQRLKKLCSQFPSLGFLNYIYITLPSITKWFRYFLV